MDRIALNLPQSGSRSCMGPPKKMRLFAALFVQEFHQVSREIYIFVSHGCQPCAEGGQAQESDQEKQT